MDPDDKRSLQWVRPPQQARSQQTLTRLLDAAEELAAEKGFDDTTVAEVARRADSSVGAFYARFRDKDALLNAVYQRYLEQAQATADDVLDPERWDGAAVPEILRAVVRFVVSVYRDQGGLIRAFVVRGHSDSDFRERQERYSDYVNARLAKLLLARSAELDTDDPERASAFALTVMFATIESSVLFGELRTGALTFSDDELAAELTRACLNTLGVVAPNSAGPRS